MGTVPSAPVGLRELRHHTGEVLARVRRGEVVDVTERGRLVARIVPVAPPAESPILDRLVAEGRASRAVRPGRLPPLLPGDGTDRLSDALRAMRAES